MRGNVDVKELGDIGRCRIVRCLKGEEQNFKVCAVFNREPIELLKNQSDEML